MVTVIGLGFVGLTTALGFAAKGHKVYGVETNTLRLNTIRNGEIPFHEPHLRDVLSQTKEKTFFVTDNLREALSQSQLVFLCVATPSQNDGHTDLSYLFKAIEEVLRFIPKDGSKVMVIKSTVPPSTAQKKIKPFIEQLGFKVTKDIGLANNPEFLREGKAWEDFIHPDRIVIGSEDQESTAEVAKLYASFAAPIHNVSLNTAEFIKYLSNTMLATMISFSNEMSMIADAIGGIDTKEAFQVLHKDRRWFGTPANMASYVFPGCGFGGACLPKDTQALFAQAKQAGYTPQLIGEVLKVNAKIREFVVEKILSTAGKEETIGILGLSFKPDTDDVRDSPSYDIVKILLDKGYRRIVAYDPKAKENFQKEFSLPIEYADSFEVLAKSASTILLLTPWKEFIEKQELLNGKKVLDFKYVLTPKEVGNEFNHDFSHV